jgi:hypothetical protein
MEDPWARSHRIARDKSDREAREAEAKGASKEIKDSIAAAEKRREALSKPEPSYKPNLPMWSPR